MSLSRILRTPQWVWGRRLVLIGLVVFLALRNYGSSISSWLRTTEPQHDVVLTQVEFRPDVGETKPAWIIGLRNTSSKYTYDHIELEATYRDGEGKVLETDKLIVRQKLKPGAEQLIGSTDFKSRPGATRGTLKVLGASTVQP